MTERNDDDEPPRSGHGRKTFKNCDTIVIYFKWANWEKLDGEIRQLKNDFNEKAMKRILIIDSDYCQNLFGEDSITLAVRSDDEATLGYFCYEILQAKQIPCIQEQLCNVTRIVLPAKHIEMRKVFEEKVNLDLFNSTVIKVLLFCLTIIIVLVIL